MKKSHIALLSALGVGLLVILAGLILGRAAVGHGREWKSETGEFHFSAPAGEYVEKSYDLQDFNTIAVEGLWEVRVTESDEYSVEVTIPDSWNGGEVFRSGDQIVFGMPNRDTNVDESAIAVITMPELKGIRIFGAASVTFDGFRIDRLDIEIEGGAQVRALDSSADIVVVELAGAGLVDLEDLDTFDARVLLDGLGEVKLNMTGGSLTGRIDGLGRVTYIGTVSNQDVSIDGMGNVRRMD